jgi:hypothetical protein
MDKNDIEKITVALANEFLNSFNINGLLEAAKQYSIKLATERVETLSDEDKENLLKDIEEREKAASKASSESTTEESKVTTENPEEQLEPA